MWMLYFGLLRIVLLSMVIAKLTKGRFHFLLPDHAAVDGEWQLALSVTSKGKPKHCRIMLDRLLVRKPAVILFRTFR